TFLLVERGRVGAPHPHRSLARSGEGLGGRAARGQSLSQAFEDSVRAHLVADVPVAVFLSSGLDSSLIAALASRILPEPPTTVTLQFDLFVRTPLDEAPLASEVARVLGTRHIERRVCRRDFQNLWPAALAAMDQPSID